MHEIIQPRDEQHWLEMRTQDITSTECGALFGLTDSSYIPTLFELWHRKKGNYTVEFKENERSRWGKRLQDSIALGIAEDQGWKVRRMDEYIRIPELRIGASFDFSIEGIGARLTADNYIPPVGASGNEDCGLLEIKNVDALIVKQKWIVDGDNIEAPPAIELQLQHQLLVSGRAFGYIAAMVGGNKVILIKREPDVAIHNAIKQKAAAFWRAIEAGIEPRPDFERDSDVISKLLGYAEPGKLYNADEEIEILMDDYEGLNLAENTAKRGKEAIKAQILMKIGDAEKVIGDGWSISAGVIGPTLIKEHTRKGFRNFKPYFKKI